MAKLALCTCLINLGGDLRNVVHRGETRPVTWPEAEVLMHVHGDDNVNDIEVIGFVERTVAEEFERLALRYGVKPVATLFPGKRPAMEFEPSKSIPRAAHLRTRGRSKKTDPEPTETVQETAPASED